MKTKPKTELAVESHDCGATQRLALYSTAALLSFTIKRGLSYCIVNFEANALE